MQKLETIVLFGCGSLWSVFLLAQVDEEHFMLDNFDASTDQGYIDVMGEIRRLKQVVRADMLHFD